MSFPLYLALTIFNLGILLFSLVYIPKRLSSWFGLKKQKAFVAGFIAISLVSMVSFIAIASIQNPLLLAVAKFGGIFIGFYLYLLTFLLVSELVYMVNRDLKKTLASLVVGLSAIFVVYGFWNSYQYRIYDIEIPMDNLQSEVSFLHLPDIHLGPYRGEGTLQSVVADIERTQPDFVVINGDLVDGLEGIEPGLLDLFSKVSIPVYFTGGNHDEYVGIKEVENILASNGVEILNNVIVERNGIQLVGLNYMNADEEVYDAHASERTETIKSVVADMKDNINTEVPTVFAHHSPVGVKYMKEAGADLVVAGHTHAGQLFPATLIAAIQYEFLKGMYDVDGTKVYVTQGVGTFGPPLRVGTEGEATLFRLVPKDKI